jgi:hypothetical protein
MNKIELPSRITVGSFFLETLTTGMYENPLHCIREYVQNSFDAIHDAAAANLMAVSDGRVVVSATGAAARQNLTIRDNGIGVPMAQAVDRFVSLGASLKRPTKHAGFRGIGRLAGIAYCAILRFTTKAAGEDLATVIEFDCAKLRAAMAPGAVPQGVSEVMKSSITASTISARNTDHFTEVEMVSLTDLGRELIKPNELPNYLRQYSPSDYPDYFNWGDQIKNFAVGFGFPIPVIEVELRLKRDRIRITKPYRNSYPTSAAGHAASTLTRIETIGSQENGWFGWFGVSNFPGEIPDATVSGLRFRQKNIQIGDVGLIENIAAKLTPKGSDRRIPRWTVGEIFIVSPAVVPNARRDGFEDNPAWHKIKNDIQEVTSKLVKLVRTSSKNRNRLNAPSKVIAHTRDQLESGQPVAPEVAREIDAELKEQLDKIERAVRAGADPKEAENLIAQIKEMRENIRDLPSASTTGNAPEQKSVDLNVILEIVKEVLADRFSKKLTSELMSEIVGRLAKR